MKINGQNHNGYNNENNDTNYYNNNNYNYENGNYNNYNNYNPNYNNGNFNGYNNYNNNNKKDGKKIFLKILLGIFITFVSFVILFIYGAIQLANGYKSNPNLNINGSTGEIEYNSNYDNDINYDIEYESKDTKIN